MNLIADAQLTVTRKPHGVTFSQGEDEILVPPAHIPAVIAALNVWASDAVTRRRCEDSPIENVSNAVSVSLMGGRCQDICSEADEAPEEYADGGLDIALTAQIGTIRMSPAQAERVAAALKAHRCWITLES